MPRRCNHCDGPIYGQGSNNAKLCASCWVELLYLVVELKVTQRNAAREFGVSNQAVSAKLAALALEGA